MAPSRHRRLAAPREDEPELGGGRGRPKTWTLRAGSARDSDTRLCRIKQRERCRFPSKSEVREGVEPDQTLWATAHSPPPRPPEVPNREKADNTGPTSGGGVAEKWPNPSSQRSETDGKQCHRRD